MVREISTSASQAYLDAAQKQKRVEPTTEVAAATSTGNTKPDTEDELHLTSVSQLTECSGLVCQSLLGVEPRNGMIQIEDIRDAYNSRLSQFTAEVNGRLREAGVDMSQGFSLRSDSMGRLVVAGDHPDKEKIAAVLAEDPELANQFRGLSAAASLLNATDEAKPFHEAYAEDPYGAVDRYSYLFDDNRQSVFNLRFGEDGAEEYFTSG